MINLSYRFDQDSSSLELSGMPDVSNGDSEETIGIISSWTLKIIGSPLLEGDKEHLDNLMQVILQYSRSYISGIRKTFISSKNIVKISPFGINHKLVLNSTKEGIKPLEISEEKNETVGIIGAGPAGLACAEQLRKEGYQVTVYDRYDRSGGLLMYGIPNFKLEKFVVERRTKFLKDSGVNFVLNFEVGKDSTLKELKNKHDAILIATGVYKSREIEIPGSNLNNIFPAMDFLKASNKKGLGDKVEMFDNGTLNTEGKNVVVIGGGDTAMDCVRTSVRQKAKSVKCLYRRDKENMPGSAREVFNAEEEGVEFLWLSNPKEFVGIEKIESLIVSKMKLGEPDDSGRRKPIINENSEFKIEADIAIKALGFDPEELPKLFGEEKLQVTKWGTIKTDFDTMETSIPGIFAAGDIIRGASLVVWAIKDGRDVAETIKRYFASKKKQKVA